jgi:hypothetical protein
MLTLAVCLACAVALDTTPTTTRSVEDSAVMADTVPFGNRFGFPFTREEYKRALRQVMPENEAEFQTRVIYEPDPEVIGFGVADTNLLWLAALSDDVARRVIAYRPQLRDAVLRIRENPESFIAAFHQGPPSP